MMYSALDQITKKKRIEITHKELLNINTHYEKKIHVFFKSNAKATWRILNELLRQKRKRLKSIPYFKSTTKKLGIQ